MKYEIWLGDDYTHFDRGIAHLDDGRRLDLYAMVHTSTFGSDSLLIDDEDYFDLCRFPLRWIIHSNRLNFYSWDGITTVLLHSERQEPIRIDGVGILLPGESMEVYFCKKE